METNKTSTTHKTLIGFRDGELYRLDTTFKYGDGMKGATGEHFELLTQDILDERNTDEAWRDYAREIWQMAAADGNTESSLDEYVEDCQADADGEYAGHDSSFIYDASLDLEIVNEHYKKYCKAADIEYEQIVCLNCTGCGRCFSKKEEYDYIINQKAIDFINEFEA